MIRRSFAIKSLVHIYRTELKDDNMAELQKSVIDYERRLKQSTEEELVKEYRKFINPNQETIKGYFKE